MGNVEQPRDKAYLTLLQFGLLFARECAQEGQLELCHIEADHLHNLPSLVGETNAHRHEYYIVHERGLYLERLRERGATEYQERAGRYYAEPWQILAAEAGVQLDE
jgi:hypothetical protein